jgi:hypothetical protein
VAQSHSSIVFLHWRLALVTTGIRHWLFERHKCHGWPPPPTGFFWRSPFFPSPHDQKRKPKDSFSLWPLQLRRPVLYTEACGRTLLVGAHKRSTPKYGSSQSTSLSCYSRNANKGSSKLNLLAMLSMFAMHSHPCKYLERAGRV